MNGRMRIEHDRMTNVSITRIAQQLSRLLALVLVTSMALAVAPAGAATPERDATTSLGSVLNRIDNQLIVRFKAGVPASKAQAKLAATGGAVRGSSGEYTRGVAYGAASGASAALRKLNADPEVVYAFYNQRVDLPVDRVDLPALHRALKDRSPVHSQSRPLRKEDDERTVTGADSLRGHQWYLDRVGDNLTPAPSTSAPIVAVIDTGMDYSHPDLATQRVACPAVTGLYCDLFDYDQDPMDTYGHGTHVAGLIAARGDASGIRGISPNSKLLPVRIFGDGGPSDLLTIFRALDYVRLSKAKLPSLRVVNMSFGGLIEVGSPAHKEYNTRLAALRAAGVLPVAAAGNESSHQIQQYPLVYGVELASMPAQSPSVLSVAATDENDYRSVTSSYSTPVKLNACEGDDPDMLDPCDPNGPYTTKTVSVARLAAPGWHILSTTPGGTYSEFAGTSMASPLVAGAAARVLSASPELSPSQAQAKLVETGVSLSTAKGFPVSTPRLDLRRALGIYRTGITGRVVNGVTGRPLAGATITVGNKTATTSAAGFYTVLGLSGGTSYSVRATAAGYAPYSLSAKATGNRLVAPGDLSLAPVRSDGGYTIVLDYANVVSGLLEWSRVDQQPEYPWPVDPATMPWAIMESYWSVPYDLPNTTADEPADSIESYATREWGEGLLGEWPYVRVVHHSYGLNDPLLSPHEGTIIRKLIPGHTRFGVKWWSAGGLSKGAKVRVYKNGSLLKTSTLALAASPTDGTTGDGKPSRFFDMSVWALYDFGSDGSIRTPTSNPNGQRTDYGSWIHRNNDVQGVPGPTPGGSKSGRLDRLDGGDVYSVDLAGGRSYTFKLSGAASHEFELQLWDKTTLTMFAVDGAPLVVSTDPGANDTLRYTVPSGAGGRYYIKVLGDGQHAGRYTLSRP